MMFSIQPYTNKDRLQLEKIVLELEKYYPGIKEWLTRKGGELDKLDGGKDFCLAVHAEGRIVGCSISSLTRYPGKNEAVKLKTFYLVEKFRSYGIGNPLLEATIDYWARRGVKKIYVSMSGEEFPSLRKYFHKYGFVFCGLSPSLYRDGSREYFMSKEMRYGRIGLQETKDFVIRELFGAQGFDVSRLSEDMFILEKQGFLSAPVRYLLAFSEEINEKSIIKLLKKSDDKGAHFSFIVSQQGPDQSLAKKFGGKVAFLDYTRLESIFYPLVFERKKDAGFIQPIQEQYSALLFFNPSQKTLSVPSKTQLRSDKVYYRSPRSSERLLRGQTMVFYGSEPTSAIIGEGRVKGIDIGTPDELYERYGGYGVLDAGDLRQRANESGKVMAISFSRTIRYPKKVKVAEVSLPVPQSTVFLDDAKLTKIREKGGYFEQKI